VEELTAEMGASYLKSYAGIPIEQLENNASYIKSWLERLKNDRNAAAFNEVDFMIGKIKSRVRFSTSESIFNEGLHNFLLETKSSLHEIGSTLNKNYFAYL
ncbi:MAG: zincin-like metallopeptidase domain-containing protein, partial [Ferruginibacter sp.]